MTFSILIFRNPLDLSRPLWQTLRVFLNATHVKGPALVSGDEKVFDTAMRQFSWYFAVERLDKDKRPWFIVQKPICFLELIRMNLNEYKQTPCEAGGGSFQKEGILHYRIQRQGLPIGAGVKPYIFSTLFCEFVLILPHPFPTVTTTFKLFAALLRPSQLFSILTTLFNSSQGFSIASHLSLNSRHLFPTLLNSSQWLSPLPTSCWLFSTRRNSAHLLPPLLFPPLLTSAQFISPHSQLILTAHLVSTLQELLPALLASFRKNALHRKTFTHRSFCTEKHLHIHKSFYTEKLLQKNFYTQQAYTQRGFLHRASFYTASFYTEKPLHSASFFTEKLLHTEEAFTQRSVYTEKLLDTASFYTESFTERSFYTQQAFTQRSFTQSKLLRRSFYTEQVFPSIDSLATSIPISTQPSGTSCDKCRIMRVSGIQAGDKCNNVRPRRPGAPSDPERSRRAYQERKPGDRNKIIRARNATLSKE